MSLDTGSSFWVCPSGLPRYIFYLALSLSVFYLLLPGTCQYHQLVCLTVCFSIPVNCPWVSFSAFPLILLPRRQKPERGPCAPLPGHRHGLSMGSSSKKPSIPKQPALFALLSPPEIAKQFTSQFAFLNTAEEHWVKSTAGGYQDE